MGLYYYWVQGFCFNKLQIRKRITHNRQLLGIKNVERTVFSTSSNNQLIIDNAILNLKSSSCM